LYNNDGSDMKTVPLFKDEFGFLSNFYISPFNWNGFRWNTVEHAFQASKTKSTYDQERIRTAGTPAIAKRLGREVELRKDWEQIKVSVMTELVWLKFEQNSILINMLLDTGSAELIEGNYWHDNYWGDCYCRKCMKYEGKNMLGFILMEIRQALIDG